ncbi:hypothetical protein [Cohaesibacter gelatinilyticus]|uniref:Uncharacterized protein n=1 Tax=Cohaesibacter gelatinilyticus TaxID=372072 RepID=A0A285PD53_9HYPH|nr:hypothetical protein [Cohaesibacter gelatinilyticus]SNZ19685.1 hypothetical protein SAMN06265368_2775 [Cohaesibacter gelatinilyticus]
MYIFKFNIKPAIEFDPTGKLGLNFLTIGLAHKETNEQIDIVRTVLENKEELDWFEKNEEAIRNEKCPAKAERTSSVAERMHEAYEALDVDSWTEEKLDGMLGELYEFRSHHELWFAFPGQDLPNIFFAANDNGHEISCHDDDLTFAYDVDISSLFDEAKRVKKFV